jgi:signal peptidase I
MLTTFLLCLTFGVLWLLELLSSAWLLQLGASWVGAARLSFSRAFLGVFLMGTALVVPIVVLYVAGTVNQGHSEFSGVAARIGAVVLIVAATWGIAKKILRTSVGKAILAWLPTLLGRVIPWALGLVLVRPFLFEAYVQSTNAMAPTILGRHVVGICPFCGGEAYISAASLADRWPKEVVGICGRCLRDSKVAVTNSHTQSGDRLISAKFLRPRRWDLIVFRYPEDPSIPYVMRVVGLPGEQVAIKNGDVWIDGARAKKPGDISGLVYLAHPLAEESVTWAPVQLNRGEYLVLGDFSRRSKDSRVWGTGAPDHPAYAVPESYVLGVVTHIYWPLRRWRIFR